MQVLGVGSVNIDTVKSDVRNLLDVSSEEFNYIADQRRTLRELYSWTLEYLGFEDSADYPLLEVPEIKTD